MTLVLKQLDFYDEKLLEKMLKSLGFLLLPKRIDPSAFPAGYKDYFEAKAMDPKLASWCVYSKTNVGYLSYWVSKRQAFDQLCTTIDSFCFREILVNSNMIEEHPGPRNPFKGCRCLEEVELKLALLS